MFLIQHLQLSTVEIKHTLAHPASEMQLAKAPKTDSTRKRHFPQSDKGIRMRRITKIPVVLFLSAAKLVQRERENVRHPLGDREKGRAGRQGM